MTAQNENSPLTRSASGHENRTEIEARGLSSADNGMPCQNFSQENAPAPEQASHAADERVAWGNARESLAVAMAGFASRSGNRDFNAALTVLDAITEPGLPLSWLRTARAASANETEAEGASVTTAEFEAAIETLRHVIHCLRQNGNYTDEEGEATDFLEPLLDARLALSRSPAMAAEAVAIPDGWKLVPIEPTVSMVVDGFESWPDPIFSTPEEWGAFEKMTGCQQATHKARLCYSAMLAAAPQPAQAEVRVGLTAEQRIQLYAASDDLQAAIRGCGMEYVERAEKAITTLLAAHPGQPEPAASPGVIAAALAVIEADRAQTLTTDHVNALDNAIKIQHGELTLPEPRAEVTGWQPIETAPPDTEVVVFWLDPESPEHPERYDFDMLDDGCWRQWTDHYEWAHSVAPAGSRLPREQAPYTHWKPLGSPAPIDAARTGVSSC